MFSRGLFARIPRRIVGHVLSEDAHRYSAQARREMTCSHRSHTEKGLVDSRTLTDFMS